MKKKERAKEIIRRLLLRYPGEQKTALNWATPWELLVDTILSAQCTDAKVNEAVPALFAEWPDANSMAQATPEDIEPYIKSLGLWRNKAKHLAATARIVSEQFSGEVPKTMDELLTLPGVARKTANIVLTFAYGINEGIAVDTHVHRLSHRMGLATAKNQNAVEKELMKLFTREEWGTLNHVMVFFGREVCTARSPKCPACELNDICPKKGVQA